MYSTDPEDRDVPQVFFANGHMRPVMTEDAPEVVREALMAARGPRHEETGIPWRWLRGCGNYRCERGHVLTFFLKSRFLDRPACWVCHARVWVTFPEDQTEGGIPA